MKALALAAALALAGCATGYEQFYTDLSAPWAGGTLPPRKLELRTGSSDAEADARRMWEDGYVAIGYSSFNGALQDNAGAKAQATKVGAEVVLLYAQYSDTAQGAIPFTSTRAVTTYGSGTVSAGGQVGSYTGSSTTYVPTTTVIPYSVRRYDQFAAYYAAMGPSCFGALAVDPTDDDRRIAGTNRVGRVVALRRGSPAYLADLLPGDLMIEHNGKPIEPNWTTQYRSGDTIALTVLRMTTSGPLPQRLTKTVVLGQCS